MTDDRKRAMDQFGTPDQAAGEETFEARVQRLERQKVSPESEDRKSSGGPASQVAPEVEPSGS